MRTFFKIIIQKLRIRQVNTFLSHSPPSIDQSIFNFSEAFVCTAKPSKKKDCSRNAFTIHIQSNLSTTTTLGAGKKWSLFRGGRYSEGRPVK